VDLLSGLRIIRGVEDFRIFEDGGVKSRGVFGLVVEPEARADLFEHDYWVVLGFDLCLFIYLTNRRPAFGQMERSFANADRNVGGETPSTARVSIPSRLTSSLAGPHRSFGDVRKPNRGQCRVKKTTGSWQEHAVICLTSIILEFYKVAIEVLFHAGDAL